MQNEIKRARKKSKTLPYKRNLKSEIGTYKNYIFEVILKDCMAYPYAGKKKVLRRIEMPSIGNLSTLGEFIIDSFGFDFDHCYGFYDNPDQYFRSKISYEMFVDIGEEPESPGKKGVKKVRVDRVFKKPGDIMLFLFDYGDNWQFKVELGSIEKTAKLNIKPKVLKSIGKAPPQYSSYE